MQSFDLRRCEVYRNEQGVNPSVETAIKLARILQAATDELLTGVRSAPEPPKIRSPKLFVRFQREALPKETSSLLLWLLKATRQVKVAMGIVTEAGFGRGRSYDFIILDEEPQYVMTRPDYDEIKRRGEELFGTATLVATPAHPRAVIALAA